MKNTILIIEDEADIRRDLVRALSLSGYSMLEAENGRTGIAKAISNHPDLIISDIMMPELDGYAVLEELQKSPATNTIPFIFLSAKSARNDIRGGMNLGADDYITKPFDIEELIEAVERRLKKVNLVESKFNSKFEALSDNLRRAMPHEIRTPLNIILGLSEFLRKNYDYTTHKDAMEMLLNINDAGKRLQRLFENYLFYANLEVNAANQTEIELMRTKTTSLVEYTIKDVIMYMAGNAGRSNDIVLDLEDGAIAISEMYFVKMIEEITDNAFKFSERGTEVKILTNKWKGFFNVFVTDNGRGMSKDQIKNIGAYVQFERRIFEQQGSGLGLTIVRRLVELHNGHFEVESQPGIFTTVKISLPIAEIKD